MSGLKDHPLFQPRGNPSPLRRWEQENCRLTLGSCLVYGGAMIARVESLWIGVPLMLLGVWLLKGWARKALGIGMILLLGGGEDDGTNVLRALWFFGGFYITWYLDGQDHKRKMETKDWDRED